MNRLVIAVLIPLTTLALAACGTTEQSTQAAMDRIDQDLQGGATPGLITKADLGEDWPLSVDSIELSCLPGQIVVGRVNGQTYAVNGTAAGRAEKEGWKEIRDLSVPGEIKGLIKDLTPILDAGLALCK